MITPGKHTDRAENPRDSSQKKRLLHRSTRLASNVSNRFLEASKLLQENLFQKSCTDHSYRIRSGLIALGCYLLVIQGVYLVSGQAIFYQDASLPFFQRLDGYLDESLYFIGAYLAGYFASGFNSTLGYEENTGPSKEAIIYINTCVLLSMIFVSQIISFGIQAVFFLVFVFFDIGNTSWPSLFTFESITVGYLCSVAIGLLMWNGLEAENTCKSCQLKWMLLYDHTLELENERVSREETVKESEYVANRHPPGRYARDHIYRVEYLYNWFRDYFRCKKCGAMDYKLRLETEEMNRSTIQVTPWVKEDNEGLAGARLGAKTSEWLLK